VRTALAAYSLGANVENLTYIGVGAFTGTGNALANTLVGGAGADRLDGGLGSDTASYAASSVAVNVNLATGVNSGGDAAGDVLVSIENLIGSFYDDVLAGDAGANALNGGAGIDTLVGGGGADSLIGGTGKDTYLFDREHGADTVNNRGQAADGDVIRFGTDVAADQLWFRHVGNDLEVSIIGGTDRVLVSGWYETTGNHVGSFVCNDGKVLADADVENLVCAMAAFAPPPAGQTQLTTDQHQQLDNVIAANWKVA
ncbi:MAG: calcium-binding protein, partial [Bacteroidota bacterium]